MTREQLNIFERFVSAYSASINNTRYYINAMNGTDDFKYDKSHKDAMIRERYGYCNWSYIGYMPLNNNFKSYSDREWWYVTSSSDPNVVELRSDLVSKWRQGADDYKVVVICPDGDGLGVKSFSMQDFASRAHLPYETRWNDEGNIVYYYDISNAPYQPLAKDVDESNLSWISSQTQWIAPCNYAEHRTGTKLLVASYNNDNTLRHYHVCKSLKQVFDLLEMSQIMSYKTFQRRVNKEGVGFFFEHNGRKMYVVNALYHAVPPMIWGQEGVSAEVDNEGEVVTSNVNVSLTQEDITRLASEETTNEEADKIVEDKIPNRTFTYATPKKVCEIPREILEKYTLYTIPYEVYSKYPMNAIMEAYGKFNIESKPKSLF